MVLKQLAFIAAVSLVLLPGCASNSPQSGGRSEQPAYGEGIQTRSIRIAPATQQMQNTSRPLSELNTPEAIASREALARHQATTTLATADGSSSSVPMKPVAAHQSLAGVQKGATASINSVAKLYAQPKLDSDSVAAGVATVTLGPSIYNAAGYWWYVTAGKESGWLLQSDMLQ